MQCAQSAATCSSHPLVWLTALILAVVATVIIMKRRQAGQPVLGAAGEPILAYVQAELQKARDSASIRAALAELHNVLGVQPVAAPVPLAATPPPIVAPAPPAVAPMSGS